MMSPAIHGLRISRFAALSLLAFGLAQAVHADDPAPLSGPKVNDTGVPGESKPFGPTASKLKHEVRGLDDRILHEALSSLRGPQVQENLRLTNEQDGAIKEATEKAASARREYFKEHEGEIKAYLSDMGVDTKDIKGEGGLRVAFERARTMREGSKRAPKDASGQSSGSQMPDENSQMRDAARQKLIDLREHMPRMDDAHSQIWAALTQPQKDIVQAKIKELSDAESAKKHLSGATRKVDRKLKKKSQDQIPTTEK